MIHRTQTFLRITGGPYFLLTWLWLRLPQPTSLIRWLEGHIQFSGEYFWESYWGIVCSWLSYCSCQEMKLETCLKFSTQALEISYQRGLMLTTAEFTRLRTQSPTSSTSTMQFSMSTSSLTSEAGGSKWWSSETPRSLGWSLCLLNLSKSLSDTGF